MNATTPILIERLKRIVALHAKWTDAKPIMCLCDLALIETLADQPWLAQRYFEIALGVTKGYIRERQWKLYRNPSRFIVGTTVSVHPEQPPYLLLSRLRNVLEHHAPWQEAKPILTIIDFGMASIPDRAAYYHQQAVGMTATLIQGRSDWTRVRPDRFWSKDWLARRFAD